MDHIVSENRVSNRKPEKWGIENRKWRIKAAGFALAGWDIISISHGCQPFDMLFFIAANLNPSIYENTVKFRKLNSEPLRILHEFRLPHIKLDFTTY